MKINNYDFTLKNIYAYIQAKWRILISKFPGFFKSTDYVQEQILFRQQIANPECLNSGKCFCNCKMPDMLYADKSCDRNCYPVMMDKETWYLYKQQIIDNNIAIKYPFEMEKLKQISFNEIQYQEDFKVEDPLVFDLGKVKRGDSLNKEVKILNTANKDIEIEQVYRSCSCTNIEYPKVIYKDQLAVFKVSIDTEDKPTGKLEVTVDIQYNNGNKKMYFVFKGEIVDEV